MFSQTPIDKLRVRSQSDIGFPVDAVKGPLCGQLVWARPQSTHWVNDPAPEELRSVLVAVGICAVRLEAWLSDSSGTLGWSL